MTHRSSSASHVSVVLAAVFAATSVGQDPRPLEVHAFEASDQELDVRSVAFAGESLYVLWSRNFETQLSVLSPAGDWTTLGKADLRHVSGGEALTVGTFEQEQGTILCGPLDRETLAPRTEIKFAPLEGYDSNNIVDAALFTRGKERWLLRFAAGEKKLHATCHVPGEDPRLWELGTTWISGYRGPHAVFKGGVAVALGNRPETEAAAKGVGTVAVWDGTNWAHHEVAPKDSLEPGLKREFASLAGSGSRLACVYTAASSEDAKAPVHYLVSTSSDAGLTWGEAVVAIKVPAFSPPGKIGVEFVGERLVVFVPEVTRWGTPRAESDYTPSLKSRLVVATSPDAGTTWSQQLQEDWGDLSQSDETAVSPGGAVAFVCTSTRSKKSRLRLVIVR